MAYQLNVVQREEADVRGVEVKDKVVAVQPTGWQ